MSKNTRFLDVYKPSPNGFNSKNVKTRMCKIY